MLPAKQRAVRIPPNAPLKDATQLRVSEVDVPALKPGEVLVRNEVAGLNMIDVYHRNGLYANASGLLGVEGAGVVAAVGSPADDKFVGRRVAYCMTQGSYAEFTAVPTNRCVVVPDDMSFETAVQCMTQGLTAHYLTHDCVGGNTKLGPQSWVLVHAAGSGTGNLVAQVASKVLGANVVGTASTAKLRDAHVRGNCKHVVDYTPFRTGENATEFANQLRALTPNGAGFHAAFDGVGKATTDATLASMRARGTVVFFGNASGPVPPLDVLTLTARGSLFVTRPSLAHFIADPDEYRHRASDVFTWVRRGILQLQVDREFALDDVGAAHVYLEEGKTTGKVIIRVRGGRL